MGEKSKNNGETKETENVKKDDGGGKSNVTVVLKADLHCEGCASKVIKCIRCFDGVENARIGDGQRITVVGKVDPVKLREKVEQKTHKKIELISPLPKKDNQENAKGKENNGGDNSKQQKKESNEKSSKDKSDEQKSKEKELPVTTAVLKLNFHCEGCIQKIHKIVTRTKGYLDMKIDRQKELVTVTGAIDMKALVEMLKKHLKKSVEIVSPKKDVEKKDSNGDEKVKVGSGDKAKSDGGGGGKGVEEAGGGEKLDGNRMQFQVGYPYPFMYGPGPMVDQFLYNPYSVGPYYAPQMFSDENPNACSVM